MRATRWILSALLVTGTLAGCAGERAEDTDFYVVQANDTLYGIAWRHDLDYHDLARWNGLPSDYRITVGQRLRLRPGAADTRAASAPLPTPGARELPRGRSSATTNRQALAGVAIPHLQWVWPTERTATPRPVQSGGVLFTGQLGQEVRAAAAGRVVYTGSGIRGYGQLVIVKHDDVLLSAYAYNREVLVSDGQSVSAGQPIARMGPGANQTPTLYFEIRVNGKPIDPLPFLNGKM